MNFKNINIFPVVIIFLLLAGCGKNDAPVPETFDPFFFKVQFVLGDVKISGESGEKVAVQGDQLKRSNIIITGKKSVADLVFGTSGVIRINENSRVTITSIADKANGSTEMNMENGKVFLTLSKLRGTGFKVKTPTAVASVRGTSFTVVSDKKGAKLSVVKGTVAVNPVKDGKIFEDKTIAVETGRKTDYIDKKAVEKIIAGEIEIPVMEMTPADKIEIQAEVKEMKIESIPDLTLEIKEEIKLEASADAVTSENKTEEKKAGKKETSVKKDDKAAMMKKLADEKLKQEEETKLQEQELKKQAEAKKVKEEKVKKDRASNIPTM